MAELGAKLSQIIKQHPLGSATLFLLLVGIAFKLLWLVVVVLIMAGSIAWFRFDQRRQLDSWVEDEGLDPEAIAKRSSAQRGEDAGPQLSLEPVHRLFGEGRALLRRAGPIARGDRGRGSTRRPSLGEPKPVAAVSPTGLRGKGPTQDFDQPNEDFEDFDRPNEDFEPSSREGDRIPALRNALARHGREEPDQREEPHREDERVSAPLARHEEVRTEEVRTRLDRPFSGLREAGKNRRGLVFRS